MKSDFVKARPVRVSFNGGNSFSELVRVTPASDTQKTFSEMLRASNLWQIAIIFGSTPISFRDT